MFGRETVDMSFINNNVNYNAVIGGDGGSHPEAFLAVILSQSRGGNPFSLTVICD